LELRTHQDYCRAVFVTGWLESQPRKQKGKEVGKSRDWKFLRFTFYRQLLTVRKCRAFGLHFLHASRKNYVGLACRINRFSYGLRWD
jgi:hypothetical protein